MFVGMILYGMPGAKDYPTKITIGTGTVPSRTWGSALFEFPATPEEARAMPGRKYSVWLWLSPTCHPSLGKRKFQIEGLGTRASSPSFLLKRLEGTFFRTSV